MSYQATNTTAVPAPTIILGGGIIGLSIAYYLALHSPPSKSNTVHVVDAAPSLLLSASGYAGGFLAKDWFSSPVASLGALSFRLHRELAVAHEGGARWGYAPNTAYSLSIEDRGVGGPGRAKILRGKEWLSEETSRAEVAGTASKASTEMNSDLEKEFEMLHPDGSPKWMTKQPSGSLDVISSKDGCAQVEPRQLGEFLIHECRRRGIQFHLGADPVAMIRDQEGKVSGVTVRYLDKEEVIEGRHVVLSAGAWTSKLFKQLFPESQKQVSVGSLAGYSIVVRSPRYSRPIVDTTKQGPEDSTGMCHSVFCSPGPHWTYAPEAISRIGEGAKPEIYIAGLNDPALEVPQNVTGVKAMIDERKMRDLRRSTVYLTGLSNESDEIVDDDLEVIREGLCFRPVTNSGRPIIAKMRDIDLGKGFLTSDTGVYIAAGHGPWGISLSLGTGLVVAEMVLGMKPSANIGGLGI